MVADRQPVRVNQSLTWGVSHHRAAPGMLGATLSCPVGAGKHRLRTVWLYRMRAEVRRGVTHQSLGAPDVTHGGRQQADLPDSSQPIQLPPSAIPGHTAAAGSMGRPQRCKGKGQRGPDPLTGHPCLPGSTFG
jgi:hypothetical protein